MSSDYNDCIQEQSAIIQDPGEFGDIQQLRELQYLHTSALRALRLKFEVLNGEFQLHHARNPIHHIESRLKSPASMAAKLQSRGHEVSIENAKQYLNDIAGVRVVCRFLEDVYDVEKAFMMQEDVKLIEREDYIAHPNFNGYRSLHLDVEIPVYLSSTIEYARAEIQIRTIAQDFWASLEHDLRYKCCKDIPEHISKEMYSVADEIAAIDRRMQHMNYEIQAL
ncbi:MAG: GTP pyrophosphokinase family protein [Eubacteriales bacterium]|nr:GTP pyrophosphokinase family protein [Clostridium sp.]MDY2926278.1 GTP pyrophosphokinase family protein [Eubacteriales bacterium]